MVPYGTQSLEPAAIITKKSTRVQSASPPHRSTSPMNKSSREEPLSNFLINTNSHQDPLFFVRNHPCFSTLLERSMILSHSQIRIVGLLSSAGPFGDIFQGIFCDNPGLTVILFFPLFNVQLVNLCFSFSVLLKVERGWHDVNIPTHFSEILDARRFETMLREVELCSQGFYRVVRLLRSLFSTGSQLCGANAGSLF
jgi:hypothetical protein